MLLDSCHVSHKSEIHQILRLMYVEFEYSTV